jgi:nucleotide-binding universal stress UspA family protein
VLLHVDLNGRSPGPAADAEFPAQSIGRRPDSRDATAPDPSSRKEETMKEITVAIDGSHGSRAAIDEAIELAGPLGAHITFVTVRKTPPPLLGSPNYECRLARDLGLARAALDAALRRAREAGIEAGGEVLEGSVVDELLSFADNRGADLIVMGSRGHGALAGALLGSVSGGVVQHANVPVLVAKQAARRQRQAA